MFVVKIKPLFRSSPTRRGVLSFAEEKEMLKFSFKEVKEICKKATNGDEIAQKVLDYIDEDISRKAMNEFVEEETGREFGEPGADRKYSDEELETMCQNNTYAITDFGKDDRKRFAVIKDIHNAKKVDSKIRNFTDEELLWIHYGTLRSLNAAINLWGELSGDDLERYEEINTPEWSQPYKKREHAEYMLQGTSIDTERASEFVRTLTGGDLHRFNKIQRDNKADAGGAL